MDKVPKEDIVPILPSELTRNRLSEVQEAMTKNFNISKYNFAHLHFDIVHQNHICYHMSHQSYNCSLI